MNDEELAEAKLPGGVVRNRRQVKFRLQNKLRGLCGCGGTMDGVRRDGSAYVSCEACREKSRRRQKQLSVERMAHNAAMNERRGRSEQEINEYCQQVIEAGAKVARRDILLQIKLHWEVSSSVGEFKKWILAQLEQT